VVEKLVEDRERRNLVANENGPRCTDLVVYDADFADQQRKTCEYSFVEEIAAEVQNRMGGIPETKAQIVAVRQLAYRLMRERNHRISHCHRDIPLVETLVRVPTLKQRRVWSYLQTDNFVNSVEVVPGHLTASRK